MSFRGDYAKENERVPGYYDGQDWTEVRIKGSKKTNSADYISQKQVISSNTRRLQNEVSRQNKLADSAEIGKVKRLTSESRQKIIAFRTSKGWTQQQLNQECLFPVNTIREIEAGRLCPNTSQLNTLNRILKTGLKYEEI